MKYYLAYGSNLNIRQMQMRCPGAKPVGTMVLEDYELLFKGSKTGSYLTIEQCEGGTVPVVVWEVTESDETALDRYEGFPNFYYKTEMELPVKCWKTDKTKTLTAFVYIMHEDRQIGMPTIRYVQTCLEGYRTFRFDENTLYDAIEKSRRYCHED